MCQYFEISEILKIIYENAMYEMLILTCLTNLIAFNSSLNLNYSKAFEMIVQKK